MSIAKKECAANIASDTEQPLRRIQSIRLPRLPPPPSLPAAPTYPPPPTLTFRPSPIVPQLYGSHPKPQYIAKIPDSQRFTNPQHSLIFETSKVEQKRQVPAGKNPAGRKGTLKCRRCRVWKKQVRYVPSQILLTLAQCVFDDVAKACKGCEQFGLTHCEKFTASSFRAHEKLTSSRVFKEMAGQLNQSHQQVEWIKDIRTSSTSPPLAAQPLSPRPSSEDTSIRDVTAIVSDSATDVLAEMYPDVPIADLRSLAEEEVKKREEKFVELWFEEEEESRRDNLQVPSARTAPFTSIPETRGDSSIQGPRDQAGSFSQVPCTCGFAWSLIL